ncbi:MAG: hypothetical protein IJV85_04425 [Clostridia bacterium]|nr:hypothetical protein [Clostridia bacterium]
MKKLAAMLSILLFSLSFCACDPTTYVIQRESLNEVTGVELIEYENPNQKSFNSWVFDQYDKLVPFNNENVTVLETLPSETVSDFLDSFSQTDILHTYYAYDSPKDICIRLHYSNGNFLIIWADYKHESFGGYIGEYLSDGTVSSFWGSFSALFYYENLVHSYFSVTLY